MPAVAVTADPGHARPPATRTSPTAGPTARPPCNPQVLRCAAPVKPSDCILGQYVAGNGQPGYTDDPTVPKGSRTPTFAAMVLNVSERRGHWHWRGTEGAAKSKGRCRMRRVWDRRWPIDGLEGGANCMLTGEGSAGTEEW